MASALADILTTLPQMAVTPIFIGKYIRAKNFRSYIGLYVLLSLLIYVVTGYVMDNAYLVRGVVSLATQIILTLAFSTIPKAHGLICLIMSNACMFLAELAADAVGLSIDPNFVDMIMMRPSWVVAWKLSFFPLVVLSYAVPVQVCRRLFHAEGDPEITRYLPFILIQAVMVLVPMFMALSFTENFPFIAVMCVINLLANLGLDLLLMHTFGKINRAHALELQQEQTQTLLQAQAEYYNQLQDNARTIRQIRHDMSNQLQTLSILLEDGATETALEQLSTLREAVSRTGKGRHTGNPVVDAVIESKLSACGENGIDFQCTGSLPAEVGVKAMYLCSLAANLLDNAIHACGELEPSQVPVIRFSATASRERVVFCCENSVPTKLELPQAEPNLTQEHGWGLSILRGIADQYHGDLQLRQQNGMVQAVLWLVPEPLPEGADL